MILMILIIMHNELQKALGKAKTNKAIRINKIPNEIMKNPHSHLIQAFMLLISSILYLLFCHLLKVH